MKDLGVIKDKDWDNLGPLEKNEARGLWGEYALNDMLNKKMGAVRYGDHDEGHSVFLFDRIHIPAYNGRTTEIDSILVCQKGVFYFEVKSWSGDAVFGERDNEKWFTAKSRPGPGVKSYKTTNPFAQNDYHEKFLSQLLPVEVVSKALFGMVLLVNASPFGIKPGNWEGDDIDGLYTAPKDIVQDIDAMPYLLSGDRVESIASMLAMYSFGKEFRVLGS